MATVLKIAGLLGLILTGILYLAVFQNLFLYEADYSVSGSAKYFDVGFALFSGGAGIFCIWYGFVQINRPSSRLNLLAFALSATIVMVMGALYNVMSQLDTQMPAPTLSAVWWLSPLVIMSAMPILRMRIEAQELLER